MLPRTVIAVDHRLNVLKKFRQVAPCDPLIAGDAARRFERDYDRLFFQSIDVIEELLRESGDIRRDSRLKLLSEPGNQVARIDLLLAEVGPDETFRRLVIVEDKLSTNQECRRDVLAQVLEYAHRVQTSLSPDDFPDAVAPWIDDYREAVARGMRTGNFLLIICGDQIDESLRSLMESYIKRLGPANLSDLILIGLPIFSDGDTHVLVPHLVGGTERATRDLTIRVEVQTSTGASMDIGKVQVTDTPEAQAGRRRRVEIDPATFMSEWTRKCGEAAANAWHDFVARAQAAQIAGLELQHFPGGGPYFALSNSKIGSASILRLGAATPSVRDLLNKPEWNSDPMALQARDRFRAALLGVPGANHGGAVDRVYVPVHALAANHEVVIGAMAALAADLR